MTFDPTRYRTGYSLGVGAVVLCGDSVLLVRSAAASTSRPAEWTIPGGFVEADETIDIAVQRDLREEASVIADLQGIVAVRSRITAHENSAYVIFLLRALNKHAVADGMEVTEARYFTLDEVRRLSHLNTLSRLIVLRAFEGRLKLLQFESHPAFTSSEYVLYL